MSYSIEYQMTVDFRDSVTPVFGTNVETHIPTHVLAEYAARKGKTGTCVALRWRYPGEQDWRSFTELESIGLALQAENGVRSQWRFE